MSNTTKTNEVEVIKETIKTALKCPHCGEEITFEAEAPTRRGVLTGVALKDMDAAQLKIEKRNAASVLYKATKRGAGTETILKNKARVDAVVSEIEKRGPVVKVEAEAKTKAKASKAPKKEPVEA